MRIAIPLFDRFTALDAIGPYEVLSRLPDAEVVFVAEEAGVVRTDTGALGIAIERTLADTPPGSVDVLLVPGGPGTRPLVGANPMIEWLTAVHPTTTWTTSVCTGALLLGAAGVLRGLPATTHWREVDRLAEFGATPTHERVVWAPEGSRVVTAAGVSAGIDMALALAARLAGDDVAQRIQVGIEYDPQPPFAYEPPVPA